MHILICKLIELLINSLSIIHKKLYVFNFFFVFTFLFFCKHNIYALEPLNLELLQSSQQTGQGKIKLESTISFQEKEVLVNESQESRSSEQEQQSRNLVSTNDDNGNWRNWIVNRASAIGSFFGGLYKELQSGQRRRLRENREEIAFQRANTVENLASRVKNYTEVKVSTISTHIRADIDRWINLSLIDRNELRFQKQGIIDKYGLSLIPTDIRDIVIAIENYDTEQAVHNWSNLTYAQRRGLTYRNQDIRSYYDISSLPTNLQNLVAKTEESDEQKKIEMEDQWARIRATATDAEHFLIATDNPEMEEYQFLGVKLFPVHRGDYAHPRTPRNGMELSLVGESIKLEIHSSTNLINYEVLAEDVQEIQLSLECPDQPDCENNIIRFKSGEQWHEFSLDQLVDHHNTGSMRYIRVVPSHLNSITDVKWESVMRSYRGSFRIQFAKQTRISELFEWSFINDLHIEDYIRSVVPSEFPVSSPINAVKAQIFAARTFALNHVIRVRTLQLRSWDVTSTTQFQLYLGVEEEDPRSDRATEETEGIILAYRGRLALTEYFSCTEMATDNDETNPIASSRNIPSYIVCEDYQRIYPYQNGGGHRRGLPQIPIMELAREGWRLDADNLPTEDAVVPENIDRPWNYRDILFYFYNDVSLYHYTHIQLR